MRVFVLTGGIGCGKSTVARLLNCNNVAVIDTDVLARCVVEPGMPGRRAIYRAFGEGVFRRGEGGEVELDRAALARAAFSDESGARKRQLDRCTHPYIQRMLFWQLARISLGMRQTEGVAPGCAALPAPAAVCLDIPLFYEAGMARRGPLALLPVLCVTVSRPEIQVARVLERAAAGGAQITREDAENRIVRQMPAMLKAELATYVIDNSGEQARLEAAVEEVLRLDLWALRRRALGREQGGWEDEMQGKRQALRVRSRELARARRAAREVGALGGWRGALASASALTPGSASASAPGSTSGSAPGSTTAPAAATPAQQAALERVSRLEASVRRLREEVTAPPPVTLPKILASWALQHIFLLVWLTIVGGSLALALAGLVAETLSRRGPRR